MCNLLLLHPSLREAKSNFILPTNNAWPKPTVRIRWKMKAFRPEKHLKTSTITGKILRGQDLVNGSIVILKMVGAFSPNSVEKSTGKVDLIRYTSSLLFGLRILQSPIKLWIKSSCGLKLFTSLAKSKFCPKYWKKNWKAMVLIHREIMLVRHSTMQFIFWGMLFKVFRTPNQVVSGF